MNYGIKKNDIERKLKFYKFEFLRKLVIQQGFNQSRFLIEIKCLINF